MVMTFAERANPAARMVSLGNLQVNLDTFEVFIERTRVRLTYQEFETLSSLIDQPDKIVPFDALTELLWHATGHVFKRRLNVVVHRLRLKLAGSSPYQVEMVRLRGYGLLTRQEGE